MFSIESVEHRVKKSQQSMNTRWTEKEYIHINWIKYIQYIIKCVRNVRTALKCGLETTLC